MKTLLNKKGILCCITILIAVFAAMAQSKIADMKWKNNFIMHMKQNQSLKNSNQNFGIKINPYWEAVNALHIISNSHITQVKVPTFNAVWAAAGNNGYTYNDPIATVVSPIYYYRLKIVDKDGKFTYSKICLINYRKTNNIISISPNPVTNLLRIATSSGEALAAHSATATINIYSSSMQLLQSIKITQSDRNAATIPVDRLAKGVYFLQLVNASKVNTVKFVKE